MLISPDKTINAVMDYWNKLRENGERDIRWAKHIKLLNEWKACRFFIGVMLDQMQPADRAWTAAEEFVNKRNHHWSYRTFWRHLAEMDIRSLRKYCNFDPQYESGYTGSYAGYNARKFPYRLRNNARIIVNEYQSIVENIWMVDLPRNNEDKIREITNRFQVFDGIGENLANMATFSLVRNHGYAGGFNSRKFLRIKLDTHVNRVLSKAILHGNPELETIKCYVQRLNRELESPADFDFAVYKIGQDYCQYNDCNNCPIRNVCNTYNDENFNDYDSIEFPFNFTNYSENCFKQFDITSFELSFSSNQHQNSHGFTLYVDEIENIKQHEKGITVEDGENLQCSLKIEKGKFLVTIAKCNFFEDEIRNIPVCPYVSNSEIIFKGGTVQNKIFITIEVERKE